MIAAALFLVKFRGLPLDLIEIEHYDQKIEIHFLDKFQIVLLNLRKCKQLLSKKYVFTGNIEKGIKSIYVKHAKKCVATVASDNAELFGRAQLESLLLSSSEADISVAYSLNNDIVKLHSYQILPYPDRILIAALAVYEAIGKSSPFTFTENGSDVTVSRYANLLRVSTPVPKIMHLIAPIEL